VTDDHDVGASRYDWERVIKRARLGTPAKAVALAMATYADLDGTKVRPGVVRLAAVTELSERSVYSALKKLTNLGLIECVFRGGHRGESGMASVYRLTIPADLLERVEMLPPSEKPAPTPAPGAGWEHSQPAPDGSQPAPGSSQPAPDDTQPAPGAPHHYRDQASDQTTDQASCSVTEVTTRELVGDELLRHLEMVDERARLAHSNGRQGA
jgi:DNA-binding transcriptional ArsR family regulator